MLRSRTVQSPNSGTPTPSQQRKRAVRERTQLSSPRPKRARIGLDSVDDDADATPVSINTTGSQPKEVFNTVSNAATLDALPEQESRNETDSTIEASSTPTASTFTQPEVFITPATSNHRRFGSEELDEDTIVINQSTDSSAHNGYHTADEEIDDSDDAPEVASTKTPSTAPQRRGPGAQKSKKQPRASAAKNELPTEKNSARTQPGIENAGISAKPSAQTSSDPVTKSGDEDKIHEQRSPGLEHDLDIIAVNNDSEPKTTEPSDLLVSTEEQSTDETDTKADVKSTEVSDTIVPSSASHSSTQTHSPAPSLIALTPSFNPSQRTTFPSSDLSTNASRSKPARTQLSRNTLSSQSTSRLPNRAGKTFESFRRNHLNSRLQLESTWSKKRSAFAAS